MSAEVQDRAQSVFISMDRIKRGPPVGFEIWTGQAILQMLRSAGIDCEEFLNWTRASDGLGYLIYFRGETPTEKAKARLI